jgi:hypothetical protein
MARRKRSDLWCGSPVVSSPVVSSPVVSSGEVSDEG